MAPPNHPFWDFADPTRGPGRGVDNYASFPFGEDFNFGWGPGPHGHSHGHHGHGPRGGGFRGRGGHRGPHGHHGHQPGGPHGFGFGGPWWFFDEEDQQPAGEQSKEQEKSSEKDHTMKDADKEKSPDTMQEDAPDPAEVTPDDDDDNNSPPPYGPEAFFGNFRGRRGFGRRGGRGCRGRRGGQGGAYDFSNMMRGFMSHPFLQHMGNAYEQYRDGSQPSDSASFSPPVDLFNTEHAYILHVALPGAKKEDIGVNWNPDSGVLSVSGVVHRPGDEAFQATLHSGERRVGMFERQITIPPPGITEKEDIDGEGISAKMEDGVLVVTVPKTEKEWTEIRKVDIN